MGTFQVVIKAKTMGHGGQHIFWVCFICDFAFPITNSLIQSMLGCLPIQDFGLTQDCTRIFRAGQRLTRCKLKNLTIGLLTVAFIATPPYMSRTVLFLFAPLFWSCATLCRHPGSALDTTDSLFPGLFEYLMQKTNFQALLHATIIAKCFKARLWENSKYVARQLDKIGPALGTALVNAGIVNFQKVESTNPRELELVSIKVWNAHPNLMKWKLYLSPKNLENTEI